MANKPNIKPEISKQEDINQQEEILAILLKIKASDPTLTLVDAACILAERQGIDEVDFWNKCGSIVRDRIKADAIENRLVVGYRNHNKNTIDSLFD